MLKVIIDGREVNGIEGQSILELARQNGIDIPTLCHDERVKSYGACGLCIVEAEGYPRLIRACATPVSPGMVIWTSSERVLASRRFTLELLLSDHSGDCRGPCIKACPAQTDVQGYVGLIANGEYREAVALIKESIPLPASIGRVCPHPCETACRRRLVEESLAIASLKYFAADRDLESSQPYQPEIKAPSGKKIAVVGAGPSGLTAAFFLAKEGHQVTVYEAMDQAGGMLRYGIPEYRLPKAVLDQEIELIAQMGVEFNYNIRLGRDINLDFLQNNYDAVFLGIGAWESSKLACPGDELPGVLGGIDFLREVALHRTVNIGERVAVVGGGNTAMDAARTALRLGAQEVMVLYRRTRAEMPAEDMEICEAEEEGIKFRFLVAPMEVMGQEGRVASIRLQQMELGEADSSGRRSPVPIPGAEEVLAVDTVISAIGQKVKPGGLEGLVLSRWGTIQVDEDNMQTSLVGVFAGGDGVTGPGIAIEAIAQGKKAAESITAFLQGNSYCCQEVFTVERQGLSSADFLDRTKQSRVQMPHLQPPERSYNFKEVNLGFSQAEAITEAGRCLECGCRDYFECKLLEYARDYEVEPQRLAGSKHLENKQYQHPFIERDAAKCILCGLCVRVCDEVMGVGALGLVGRGFDTMVQPEFGLPLEESSCINCGQCVALCPTGALVERCPVKQNLPVQMKDKLTTCSFCGAGCGQVVNSRGSLLLRMLPVKGEILCQRGRFGFAGLNKDRINRPLIRNNSVLTEASWEVAWERVAGEAARIMADYPKEALALAISPAYTLEEANAAAQLGRAVLGTENLFSFSACPGEIIEKILGDKAYCNKIEELEEASLIILVGSLNQSQVAAVKIRKAVKAGARLVVISSESTLLDDLAEVLVRTADSQDFLRQVVASSLQQGLLSLKLEQIEPELIKELKISQGGGLPGSQAEKIARIYGQASKPMLVVDGHSIDSAGAKYLALLDQINGKPNSSGSGIIFITPGANELGIRQAGFTKSREAILANLRQGEIKGLFILGEDPAGMGMVTKEELQKAELFVVVSTSVTATAKAADVVLPGSAPWETSGSYLSCDGATRLLNRALPPAAGLDNQEIIAGMIKAIKDS